VVALDDLTMRVRSGEIHALLGPNGAGKSTTVRILSTLSRPRSGSAQVAGHDVVREPEAVRGSIGLVSQKPSAAPLMTARESLVMAARIHGMNRVRSEARATELLDRFGLGDAADRLTRTLSGGMNRRLDIAIALVNEPGVLFLDEPTTGLDPEARVQLWAEIARLASTDRITVLLTTHYLDEADHLADRVAIIDRGRLVAEGTPDELKSELNGDRVVFELLEPTDGPAASQCLAGVPGLTEISVDGRLVRARTDHGAAVITTALERLEAAGVEVGSATLSRPSLDDVYLRHAGRAFEEVAR
jgi:ABC-2 type transport system ATP-binding protein